jgi:hypothetical protein
MMMIINTCSNVSILQPEMSGSDKATNMKPYGVTVQELDIKGRQSVTFEFGSREVRHPFIVLSLPTDAAGRLQILWKQQGPLLILNAARCRLPTSPQCPEHAPNRLTGQRGKTVFSWGKEGCNPQPNWRRSKPTRRC